MIPCLGCHRHIQSTATSCPFCGATSGEELAPRSAWPALLLGLALFGCGTKSDGEGGGDSVSDSDESTSISVGEDASITDVNSAGCMTYAGPGCSGTYDSGWPSDDETTDTPTTAWTESSSSGDDTSGTSGTESTDTDSSGTDTSGTDSGSSSDTGASSESSSGTA